LTRKRRAPVLPYVQNTKQNKKTLLNPELNPGKFRNPNPGFGGFGFTGLGFGRKSAGFPVFWVHVRVQPLLVGEVDKNIGRANSYIFGHDLYIDSLSSKLKSFFFRQMHVAMLEIRNFGFQIPTPVSRNLIY